MLLNILAASSSWSPSPLEKKYAQNPTDISRAQLPATVCCASAVEPDWARRGAATALARLPRRRARLHGSGRLLDMQETP